jgi:N-methylhydantoinase B
MGGGGYGDPIDRDPAAVLRDVRSGLVSDRAARDVYGVVMSDGALDEEATWQRRMAVREQRVGRSLPASVATRADVPTTGRRLGEYLQRGANWGTQCTWCGQEFAPAGANWKDHAVLQQSPLTKAGPHRPDSGEFTLIESSCPSCGTLLETEVARYDSAPLHDRVTSWPEASRA